MNLPPPNSSLGYTVLEISAICDRSYVWVYRRIWAGELKVLVGVPTNAIAPEELHRFLAASTPYPEKREKKRAKTTKSKSTRKKGIKPNL